MLLHQVALVLRLQVAAPVAGKFELAARSLQYFDAFGVVEALEIVLQHEAQPLQQPRIPHLVHELEVLAAVLQRIADQVLEEVLGQLHVVLQVVERRLGLDHPELRRMARRIGVLGAERGAEGVDASQRQRAQLALELSRHREITRLAEEVLRVVHLSLGIAGDIVQIERRHLEHGPGAFAVRSGDDRGVEIVEAVPVEILVDGVGHGVTDAEHGAEGVGARTQVGDVAQELQRVALLLQGVAVGIGRAVDLDVRSLHLDALPRAGRGHEPAVHTDAGPRGHGFEPLFGDLLQIDHHLYVRNARPVVQGNEGHVLVSALGAHPAFDHHVGVHGSGLQNFYDSLRFHIICFNPVSGYFSELTKLAIICDLAKKKYLCTYSRTESGLR